MASPGLPVNMKKVEQEENELPKSGSQIRKEIDKITHKITKITITGDYHQF